MIVLGYQGIGKSTLSKKGCGFIDLESSLFYHNEKRPKNWHVYYCQIAEHLSEQGYVVLISAHAPIREYLKDSNENTICVYPSLALGDEWKKKLRERYEETGSDKDYRAWICAEDSYHVNISELMDCGMPRGEISSMDYSLKEIIKDVIVQNRDIYFKTWKVKWEDDE